VVGVSNQQLTKKGNDMSCNIEQTILNRLVGKPQTIDEIAASLNWGTDKVRKVIPKLIALDAVAVQGSKKFDGRTLKVYYAVRERVERPVAPTLKGKATPWDALLRR
jgi:predicted ArsR family transcriptional regulator